MSWKTGGRGRVEAIDARTVTLRSTVPSPPGSRLEGELDGEPGATLRVKVHACRRQAEGDFVIEGRPIDLARDVRVRLETGASPPGGTQPG